MAYALRAEAIEEAGRRVVFEDAIDSFQHTEFGAFDAWCGAFGMDDTPGYRTLMWDIYQQEVRTAVEWAMEHRETPEPEPKQRETPELQPAGWSWSEETGYVQKYA